MIALITGGARSGKSAFAERYAEHLAATGIYIATAQPFDGEMSQRIAHHQQRRGMNSFRWHTIEEPLQLAERMMELASSAEHDPNTVVLVDCLTLWLTNVILQREHDADTERQCEAEVEKLVSVLSTWRGRVLLVTNEVGQGIVPPTPLGRLFRDISGRMNQRMASISDQVFLVTSGIPVEIKSLAFRWPS
jgi:adenosylcobinamide kinase/adenosylcobinamide-phosphate guanylyltransferase